jgi:hypothetical protein
VLVIAAERYLLARLTSMRVRCLILVGFVALAACGSSSGMARHGGTVASCGPPRARTLAGNRVARVYQSANSIYGCSTVARRSYLLGASARSIRQGRAGPLALAGLDVAYGLSRYGVDTISSRVVVRNLASGKEVRSAPATTRPLGPEFFQVITSIVVKPDGAVAWIAQGGSVVSGRRTEVEVNRADARGGALLDSGSGIDDRSLRLNGSTITWRDRGRTRSGSLK